uniref:Uncharacterized protein n=1 Tax=Cannabis sativa TaxID=3483 RepID=A0A803NQ65_CANSA
MASSSRVVHDLEDQYLNIELEDERGMVEFDSMDEEELQVDDRWCLVVLGRSIGCHSCLEGCQKVVIQKRIIGHYKNFCHKLFDTLAEEIVKLYGNWMHA